MTATCPRRERLCLFTRYPTPGTTKTRLIPKLGKTGAANLQREMTAHIFDRARALAALRGVEIEIRYEGGDLQKMQQWLGADMVFTVQNPGDIGQRMARAIEEASAGGIDATVIIGSDIPGISTDILNRAFIQLKDNDIVLGPARDGGYYLIGIQSRCLKIAVPALFNRINWGADTVLPRTLDVAHSLNLTHALLKPLADVDRPEDLIHWEKAASDRRPH